LLDRLWASQKFIISPPTCLKNKEMSELLARRAIRSSLSSGGLLVIKAALRLNYQEALEIAHHYAE
jgi:hypothetical protein